MLSSADVSQTIIVLQFIVNGSAPVFEGDLNDSTKSREILNFTQVTARFIWSSVPLSFRRESEREEADYNAEKQNKKGAWDDLNY